MFITGCGFLMHPVRPERVQDFERFLAYVRDALARSSNPRVRSQATGWRFFKASEPGPNGVALYVFWIDPAVAGADYALGPILGEVYTDPAQLTEIWALYTGSVTSGGTLLNLSPVPLTPPQPIVTPPVNAPAAGQNPVAQTPAAVTPPVPAPTTKPAPPAAPVKC
jgi:cell division septation protein DedD